LEGVFAQGHVYVMVSRVTDPANFALAGLPPKDLVEEVASALRDKGRDIDEVFQRACCICNEFDYDPCRRGAVQDRFYRKFHKERTVPVTWRDVGETLNPQQSASVVIHRLLAWIDRCDAASQNGCPRPQFQAEDGAAIFPPEDADDYHWWLTGVQRKDVIGHHD